MDVSSFQLAGAATPKHDGSEGRIVPAAHSCQRLMSLSDFTENPPKSHQNTMAAKAGSCLQPTAAASAYSNFLILSFPKLLRKLILHTKAPWHARRLVHGRRFAAAIEQRGGPTHCLPFL